MLKKLPSDRLNATKKALFFCELQLITVSFLIRDSYVNDAQGSSL